MKKGVSSPPSVEAALLMAQTAYGSQISQSSLRPFAKGTEGIAKDSVDSLGLSVGVLVVCRPHDQDGADAPSEFAKQGARELRAVIQDQHIGDAIAGAQRHLQNDLRRFGRGGR